jgi:hypothetical protein
LPIEPEIVIARNTQLPHNRLIDLLNDHAALEGRMWAIKITGAFDSVTADADGRQEPPYRPEQAQKSPPARQQTPRRSSSRAIRFLEPAISSARVPGQRFRQESPQVGGSGLAVRYDDHLTELDRHESRHLAQSSWFLTYPKDQRQISYKSMS